MLTKADDILQSLQYHDCGFIHVNIRRIIYYYKAWTYFLLLE